MLETIGAIVVVLFLLWLLLPVILEFVCLERGDSLASSLQRCCWERSRAVC